MPRREGVLVAAVNTLQPADQPIRAAPPAAQVPGLPAALKFAKRGEGAADETVWPLPLACGVDEWRQVPAPGPEGGLERGLGQRPQESWDPATALRPARQGTGTPPPTRARAALRGSTGPPPARTGSGTWQPARHLPGPGPGESSDRGRQPRSKTRAVPWRRNSPSDSFLRAWSSVSVIGAAIGPTLLRRGRVTRYTSAAPARSGHSRTRALNRRSSGSSGTLPIEPPPGMAGIGPGHCT